MTVEELIAELQKQDLEKIKRRSVVNLKPLLDTIIVSPLKMNASDVYLPNGSESETGYGKVISVGPGIFTGGELVPVNVKVGETVLYRVVDTFKNETSIIVVIRESDVLTVVSK